MDALAGKTKKNSSLPERAIKEKKGSVLLEENWGGRREKGRSISTTVLESKGPSTICSKTEKKH